MTELLMEMGKLQFFVDSLDPADPRDEGMQYAHALEAAEKFTRHNSKQLVTPSNPINEELSDSESYFSGYDSDTSDNGE
jgi:hypothetical protein